MQTFLHNANVMWDYHGRVVMRKFGHVSIFMHVLKKTKNSKKKRKIYFTSKIGFTFGKLKQKKSTNPL